MRGTAPARGGRPTSSAHQELEAAAAAARAAAEANAEQARAAKAAGERARGPAIGRRRGGGTGEGDDAKQYAALTAERDTIDAEIAELAEGARGAARKAAARAAARPPPSLPVLGLPARARRAAARRGGLVDGGSSSGGSSDSAGLSYPVSNPYVTSPYGMRVHLVTGVYKLHDGTDFRALLRYRSVRQRPVVCCGLPRRLRQPGGRRPRRHRWRCADDLV